MTAAGPWVDAPTIGLGTTDSSRTRDFGGQDCRGELVTPMLGTIMRPT